jgi:hypothetical protein
LGISGHYLLFLVFLMSSFLTKLLASSRAFVKAD